METKNEELTLHLQTLTQALQTLEELMQGPYSIIVRDAAIQRFEYTFELTWKFFRKVAKIEGIEVVSPRQAIRALYDLGCFSSIDLWFEFLEGRNLTSHTYNQLTADQVFEKIKKFPDELRAVLQKISGKYPSFLGH